MIPLNFYSGLQYPTSDEMGGKILANFGVKRSSIPEMKEPCVAVLRVGAQGLQLPQNGICPNEQ